MKALIAGAVGGLVATAPMTAAMKRMHRRLPARERYPLPQRIIAMRLAKRAGVREKLDEPERRAVTLLAHYGYGTFAGSLFGLLAPRTRIGAVAGGVGYGLFVWAGSYLGLLPSLRILAPATQHPPRRNAMMIVSHVVWGATLGLLASLLRHDAEEGA